MHIMYACLYVCVQVHVHVWMYSCISLFNCMHVCMFEHLKVGMFEHRDKNWTANIFKTNFAFAKAQVAKDKEMIIRQAST